MWLRIPCILVPLLLAGPTLPAPGGAAPTDTTCAPWPGEPSPLPTTRDRDRFRWTWAAQRARELALLAERVAEQSRPASAPLWRHALCLDPRQERYREGLEAATVARVFRPPVAWAVEPADVVATTDLLEALRVWVPREPEPLRGDAELRALDLAIRGARFEEALELAGQARRTLVVEDGPATQRARVEVLAAIASVGMGREDQARLHLERASRIDPALRLEATDYSPKLVQLWRAVTSAGGATP
jgi:hypothetical protein